MFRVLLRTGCPFLCGLPGRYLLFMGLGPFSRLLYRCCLIWVLSFLGFKVAVQAKALHPMWLRLEGSYPQSPEP